MKKQKHHPRRAPEIWGGGERYPLACGVVVVLTSPNNPASDLELQFPCASVSFF